MLVRGVHGEWTSTLERGSAKRMVPTSACRMIEATWDRYKEKGGEQKLKGEREGEKK